MRDAAWRSLVQVVARWPWVREHVRHLAGAAAPTTTVVLDFPVNPEPRYGYGRPPHPALHALIDRNRHLYAERLTTFLGLREHFLRIPVATADPRSPEPTWINPYFPSLDAVALYGFLASGNPARYVEIGSGYSTKFARRAIRDQGLRTTITSIDPQPRAEVEALCECAVRRPVEEVELELFDELEAGDILFVDNSHRSFMNSDVTVVFLDILPRLKPGVLVEFHDIYLPLDYHIHYRYRYFNEQYLLAAWLLAGGHRLEVVFPSVFIGEDAELGSTWRSLLRELEDRGGQSFGRHSGGASFWVRVT